MKEQLPDFILAEIFNNALVHVDEPKQKVVAKKPETKNWFLGNNEKKIIVLVNDNNNVYLSDEHLNFLTGILNACKLNIAHIALINFANKPMIFAELKKELQAEFVLSFGINALQIQLPFDMPDHQVQQYNNCHIVTAPALHELNQQTQQAKTEKAKLWKSLQKMFNLEK